MRTLALVPARAGSKGIPFKNRRAFCGRPLTAWAVDIGLQTCNRTYISSDDAELDTPTIRGEAGFWLRSPELALDSTPMLAVVQDALKSQGWLKAKVIVILQPTQPLRRPEHVIAALNLLEESKADSVVSVVTIPAHYSPDYAMKIMGDVKSPDRLVPFMGVSPTRRQDCRVAYSRDGTCYCVRREVVEGGSLYGNDCRALIIPKEESCNLDDESDWAEAERRMHALRE